MTAADRVFMNAKVYSILLDDTEIRAEAVAIQNGKFVFVGTNEGVKEWIGPDTQVTDCQGNSVLPGFGDAHMHIALAVRRFGVADVSGAVTSFDHDTVQSVVDSIVDIVKEFAANHPNDPVVHGSGWEDAWFSGALKGEPHMIDRYDLDRACADRPVCLDSADGHVCILNSKALELAGLTKDSPDAEAGSFRRFEDGTPTGYIKEPVLIAPVCNSIPGFQYTDEQHHAALLKAQDFFASRGFTFLCDCMEDPSYRVIKEMGEAGELKVRIDGVYLFNDASREEDFAALMEKRGTHNVGDLLKVDTAKFFLDGEFAMLEPYSDEYCDEAGFPRGSGTYDGLLWDPEHLKETMIAVQKEGFGIHVHSYGDLAARITIDSMEAAKAYDAKGICRNVVAHCFWVDDADKKRMAELGLIDSLQPQWFFENKLSNPIFVRIVGEERFRRLWPYKSMLDAGVMCACGSDFTVTLPNALEGISVAMTRTLPKSHFAYESFKDVPAEAPEECIDLKQAIKGWTIMPAYQWHRDEYTGSIEVGKSAELVCLNGDIETVPAEDICLMSVVETVFKGATTFKA